MISKMDPQIAERLSYIERIDGINIMFLDIGEVHNIVIDAMDRFQGIDSLTYIINNVNNLINIELNEIISRSEFETLFDYIMIPLLECFKREIYNLPYSMFFTADGKFSISSIIVKRVLKRLKFRAFLYLSDEDED